MTFLKECKKDQKKPAWRAEHEETSNYWSADWEEKFSSGSDPENMHREAAKQLLLKVL